MAVRRISDLPVLSTYYPDAALSDCMLEMSYAEPNQTPRLYRSFSVYADYLNTMQQADLINSLPIASKTRRGIVKIGDNINVNNEGTINVNFPTATTTTAGIIKAPTNNTVAPGSSEIKILTYRDGNWGYDTLQIGQGTSEPLYNIPALYYKEIIDLTYPVGSMFISMLSSVAPPGIPSDTKITTTTTTLSAMLLNHEQLSSQITWQKLTLYASFWNVALSEPNMGKYVEASLPTLDTGILSVSDSSTHTHGLNFWTRLNDDGGNRVIDAVYKLQSDSSTAYEGKNHDSAKPQRRTCDVDPGGKHSHKITVCTSKNNPTLNNRYNVYNRTDAVVRPTSYYVNAWKRIQ